MPSAFDERTLASISTHISTALEQQEVWFGRVSTGSNAALTTAAVKITEVLKRKYSAWSWASADVVAAFLADRLNDDIRRVPRKGGEPPSSLRTLEGFGELPQVARRLAESISSLPWAYELLLPTHLRPADEATFPRQTIFAEGFEMIVFDSKTAAEYSLPAADGYTSALMHLQYPASIEVGRLYFVRRFTGYLPAGEFNPELDYMTHCFKGLLGLLLVDNLLQVNGMRLGPPAAALPIIPFLLTDDGGKDLLPLRWLTAEDTDLANGLQFSNAQGNFHGQLAGVAVAFGDTRTRSSARWYLDSFSRTTGAIQRIVSATISIESLLGDKKQAEKLGLTSLLANRLAYLVGHSASHRDDIIRQFERLYDVRSHIVHSGKATLEASEKTTLTDLQELTWYALKRQIGDARLRSG